MADARDIVAVIASALTEISVNGMITVEMDGWDWHQQFGILSGESLSIKVVVTRPESQGSV